MPGQTELHPIKGACRHLRGRYSLQPGRKSPFPERKLIRYECEQGRDIASDEDIDKCMEAVITCWQEQAEKELPEEAPESPKED